MSSHSNQEMKQYCRKTVLQQGKPEKGRKVRCTLDWPEGGVLKNHFKMFHKIINLL
jgi:hypothetical protein